MNRLAHWHGTSRKFVRAQRELTRQAVDLAFAEPSAPSLVEPLPRVSNAWVRRFVLDAAQQGLDPDYAVADAGTGLRAGQLAAWGQVGWWRT